jgi:DNA-binding transcriptional LysR family regulator
MNLAAVDLNLLVALDALLKERSVSHAARRLGLSQPAASHALARLRALFDDPLFVRCATGIEPTPRALALAPSLESALAAVRATLAGPARFDPATDARTFRWAAADAVAALLLPPMVERIGREAPSIVLHVQNVSGEDVDRALIDGELHAAVVPTAHDRAGVRHKLLWKESFVCVLRGDHPMARKRTFTLDDWLSLRHVVVTPRGTPGSLVDTVLAERGQRRMVSVMVPHFLLAPPLVARSDLSWTAPERVGREYAARFGLAVRSVPLALEGFSLYLRWHERNERDPGHRWLRSVMNAAVRAGTEK